MKYPALEDAVIGWGAFLPALWSSVSLWDGKASGKALYEPYAPPISPSTMKSEMNDDIPGTIAHDTSSAGSGNVEYCQNTLSHTLLMVVLPLASHKTETN